MNGKWIPEFTESSLSKINDTLFYNNFVSGVDFTAFTLGQLFIHFLHRINGYLVFLIFLDSP